MVPTRRLPLIALAAAATLVTSGCFLPVVVTPVVDRTTPTPTPGGAQAGWRDCRDVPTSLVGRAAPGMTYECKTIQVPKDWANPGKGTFDLALLRVRSRGQHDRIGSLVLNPGGPGGSGIDMAVYLSFGPGFGGLPDQLTDRFDIVGFDPRGVGRSSPVKCIPDRVLDESFGYDPDPRGQAEFNGFVDLNRTIADDCAAKYGNDLSLYSTEQSARDMDAVRAAVGDQKITYLGYSYGTLLGATYAHLFPQKIRAFVLDGAVDPTADVVAASENQAKGFELAYNDFATWCAATPSHCPIAPDAKAAVSGVMAKARSSPVLGADGREATAGWVFDAVVSAMYSQRSWPDLANAISDLEGGDPKGVFQLADQYAQRDDNGRYTNLFDAFYAISCADEASPPISIQRVRALQSEWRRKYPLFGASLAVSLLQCQQWTAPHDPYPTGAAKGAPPIVVIGTTGDPATPYEQTAKLADLLGVGVVLTWEGEGHTAYPGTKCITDAVDAYLIDLRVPPKGQRCPPR